MKPYFSAIVHGLSFLLFPLIGWTQPLQGQYTGTLKLQGMREELNLQMELVEQEGGYVGVMRSRYIENGLITGCDNIIQGKVQGKNFVITNLIVLKESEVDPGSCDNIRLIRLSLGETPTGEINLSGPWEMNNSRRLGQVVLTQVDTTVSFTAMDDLQTAMVKINEARIASAFTDSTRIGLILNRPLEWVDTLVVQGKEAVLRISAPEADRFHQMTVLFNGSPVFINRAPRQRDLLLKIQELVPGDSDIFLLCEHAISDVVFDVTVTLEYAGQEKKWNIPVTTYKNKAILLKVQE